MERIPKITEEQRLLMQRLSVYALSTRPSEQGKKEMDVKTAMYAPIGKVCDFIDAIVDAANAAIDSVHTDVENIEPTQYVKDEITTSVDYTLVNNAVKTYSAVASSVKIIVPEDVEAGFNSAITFFTGDSPLHVTFVSNGKIVKLFQYGANVGEYNASKNARVNMYAYSNDGEYVDIFIFEA